MKVNQELNGTIIGAIFSASSLLLTWTFIVPLVSILPGLVVESIMSSIIDNEPYSNVGKATLIALISIFVVSIVLILIKARKRPISNRQMFVIMAGEFFLVHSVGFYIYWATLNFRGDGQLIFGVLASFPASSFVFVALGFLIDWVKVKTV